MQTLLVWVGGKEEGGDAAARAVQVRASCGCRDGLLRHPPFNLLRATLLPSLFPYPKVLSEEIPNIVLSSARAVEQAHARARTQW